jgi:flagellar basal body-associated protein FliL
MKTIQTEEQREKSRKRNTQIIGIVLAVLMLGSTLGYAFSMFFSSRSAEPIPINSTAQPDQPLVITYNGLSFALFSTMQDISIIPVNITRRVSDYAGATIFIASEDDLSRQELAGVLTNYAGRVQQACYGPCASEDLPEKTCADNLIVVRSSVAQGVSQQQNCIFIDGDINAVDAFLYRLFRLS